MMRSHLGFARQGMGAGIRRLVHVCLACTPLLLCSGCVLLRLLGLGEVGMVARAGAAATSAEAMTARLALVRPTAYRAGLVAMDDAAAARIAAAQPLAATPQELSTLRSMGLSESSAAGQAFLRSLVAVDSQMSTIVIWDSRFAGIRTGQQAYTSVASGAEVRAGWVRRSDRHTWIFNDGRRDVLKSKAHGDAVHHYSMRSNGKELVGRTLRSDQGLSFDAWDVTASRYRTTGYATRTANGGWELYSVDGSYSGTLSIESAALTDASRLSAATGALALGSAAVLALSARFSPPARNMVVSCSYMSPSDPDALQCDKALLALLAKEAERIGYSVVLADAHGYEPKDGRIRDPSFSVDLTNPKDGKIQDPSYSHDLTR